MSVTLPGIETEVISRQPENAISPMRVTPSGITVSPVQAVPSIRIPFTTTTGFSACCAFIHSVSRNTPPPISVSPSGISTCPSEEQPENACDPTERTLAGILTAVSAEQPAKAVLLMVVRPAGRETEVSPVQLLNALLPMTVTVSGMEIPVSFSQPKNDQLPISVTGMPPSASGITTSPPSPPYFVTVAVPCSALTIYVKSPSVSSLSSALAVRAGRSRCRGVFCGSEQTVSAAAARTLRICFCECFIEKPPLFSCGVIPLFLL